MISLHQYPGVWGLTSLSPFCIKVEFFLKATGLPYTVKEEINPGQGPKGKMPFIVDQGEPIPDSSFIIRHLIKKYGLQNFDISDPAERARAHALQNMIEEGLYFVLLYSRWVDPDGYSNIKEEFKPFFPRFIRGAAISLIQKSLVKQAKAQGIGRHSKDEVYEIGREHIKTLSVFLGEKKYFFEEKLTCFDASAYAFLVTILKQPFKSPLKDDLMCYENLVSYVHYLNRVLT